MHQIRLDILGAICSNHSFYLYKQAPPQPHKAYGILVNISCLMIPLVHTFSRRKITSIYLAHFWGASWHFQVPVCDDKITSPGALKRITATRAHTNVYKYCTHICSGKTSEPGLTSIQERALGDSFILETTAAELPSYVSEQTVNSTLCPLCFAQWGLHISFLPLEIFI